MKKHLLIVLLLVSGCASGRKDEVVVELWAFGQEGEVVEELLPGFARRHPGIRVRVQRIPWTAAHEKLLTAFAGDAVPDLCQLGNTWIPEFVTLGALEPLDEWIAGSQAVARPDYFEGVWDTNVLHGRTYGLPWYVDTRALFYRKDLLRAVGYDEPPDSWAEWRTLMERLKARGGPDRFAILLPTDEWAQPVILGMQQESALVRDDGRWGDFRGPAFRKAFTFLVDLYRSGLAPAVGRAQIGNLYQDFANGYFALYISGPWNIGEFRRRMPDSLQDAWMTAPLPGPDAGTPGVSLAGGSSLVLFEASPHKAEAWKLVEYLSEPEQQIALHHLTGNLPARKSAWQDSLLAGNPYAHAFFEQLERVRPTPKIPEWERIATKIAEHAEAAARGSRTVDQALAALDRDVDLMLEKRRWMLARDAEKVRR